MNKKAFLLFEVTLTVAILSLGLVFVIRSLSTSVRAAKASFNYTKAINLAYEKAFDLELESSDIDGIQSLSDEGNFLDNENFNWQYNVEDLAYERLGKLTLDISWKEGKRETGFDIVTYVKTKE